MKLDVLAFAAHPDDIELGAGGTLILLGRLGYRVGVVDMTRGEFGSRGDMATRLQECAAATRIMGLAVRENLELPDGHLQNDRPTQLKIVEVIRKYRPEVVFTHYWDAPHPDHRATSQAVVDACYLAGLAKIPSDLPRWRPRTILYHQVPMYVTPSLIVDISDVWEQKMQAILAYRSQFMEDARDDQPPTALSRPEFIASVEARGRFYGSMIRVAFGEPFVIKGPLPVRDLAALFVGRQFRPVP